MFMRINEQMYEVNSTPDTPLLYVLSDELGFKGPRFGCGLAQCGSCSVLADGNEIRACVMPLEAVKDQRIVTLEGLAGFDLRGDAGPRRAGLHPVQRAMIERQAAQCGYCYNGMAIKSAELLARNASPSEADIRQALAGHLCRCGTYQDIVESVLDAAAAIRSGA